MNLEDTLALLVARHTFTLMRGRIGDQINDRTRKTTSQHGRTLGRVSTGNLEAKLQVTLHDQPRASSRINDNYCVTKLQARLLAGSPTPRETINIHSNVNFHVVPTVHTAPGHSQKRKLSPGSAGCYCKEDRLKNVKSVSCVTQLSVVNPVTNVKNAAQNRPVGAKLLANLTGSGCRSESSSNLERGLHPPLSDPAQTHKVSHSRKLLWQSPQERLPAGVITSAYRQKCSGTSAKPNISGIFHSTIFSPKAQQQMETYIRSEQTESFPQGGEIQNGDTGNHQDVPPTRGVGHLNRFQGHLLPYTNTGTVQEIAEISCPGSDIPIQSPAFRSVHRTLYCLL